MTRKDTILVAVLINAALLATLFITARIYDKHQEIDQLETAISFVTPPQQEYYPSIVHKDLHLPKEESIAVAPKTPFALSLNQEYIESELPGAHQVPLKEEKTLLAFNEEREIFIKKGDSLATIAKTYGTDVETLKKINKLEKDTLSIGQKLKISRNKEIVENDSEANYYILKTGDNPWKIAKQCGVKVEDIVRLNGLNEEKARNLKAGDRIRVR